MIKVVVAKNNISTERSANIFSYLALLTGFFLLLEISFFIQCNRTYLSDYTFMTDHLDLPIAMLPGIIYFVFAELLIHFIYCAFIWMTASYTTSFFQITHWQKIFFAIGLWLLGILSVFAANQYFFPNSKFSELSMMLFNRQIALIIWLSGLVVFSCCITFVILYSQWIRRLLLACCIFAGGWYGYYNSLPTNDAATTTEPNVILIGMDSVRPDFLGFFGHAINTPFIDQFLAQSFVLRNAITPLARTFPSWTSILTGEYPHTTGIRTNLSKQDHANLSTSLPLILKQKGYETIYATDETRFSNIGEKYGFDRMVTPPMGINDFLLGTFNDFPLSNLVVNTTIGRWLFPYSYANRPAYFIYEPNSFLQLIKSALYHTRTKPLFLAVHFCLPHYPYLWARLDGRHYAAIPRYEMSIEQVDQQLHDFFVLLQNAHLLEHAIVVLLSDHGEALELPGDRMTEEDLYVPSKAHERAPRFYPHSLEHEAVNQSVGHGTDVLSLTQYHTLLAFKAYGMTTLNQGASNHAVSLLDIQPTILDLLKIKPPQINTTQRSLTPYFNHFSQHADQQLNKRYIVIESDFTPEAIRTVYPEMQDVILEGIQLFQIDPFTTRLTVTEKMNKKIIASKQFAALNDHWILAMYPQNTHQKIFILVNRQSGQWTDNLQSNFAKTAPVVSMLAELKKFTQ